jgi:hypothetical protein
MSGCRLLDVQDADAMSIVIKTCVVLHNLIINYEHAHNIDPGYIHNAEYVPQHPFTIKHCTNEQTHEDREGMIDDMKMSKLTTGFNMTS